MATQPTLEHPQKTLDFFESQIGQQEAVVAEAETALRDATWTLGSMKASAAKFHDRYAAEGYELKPLSWKAAKPDA